MVSAPLFKAPPLLPPPLLSPAPSCLEGGPTRHCGDGVADDTATVMVDDVGARFDPPPSFLCIRPPRGLSLVPATPLGREGTCTRIDVADKGVTNVEGPDATPIALTDPPCCPTLRAACRLLRSLCCTPAAKDATNGTRGTVFVRCAGRLSAVLALDTAFDDTIGGTLVGINSNEPIGPDRAASWDEWGRCIGAGCCVNVRSRLDTASPRDARRPWGVRAARPCGGGDTLERSRGLTTARGLLVRGFIVSGLDARGPQCGLGGPRRSYWGAP